MHILTSTSPLDSLPFARSCGSSPDSLPTAVDATTGVRAGLVGVTGGVTDGVTGGVAGGVIGGVGSGFATVTGGVRSGAVGVSMRRTSGLVRSFFGGLGVVVGGEVGRGNGLVAVAGGVSIAAATGSSATFTVCGSPAWTVTELVQPRYPSRRMVTEYTPAVSSLVTGATLPPISTTASDGVTANAIAAVVGAEAVGSPLRVATRYAASTPAMPASARTMITGARRRGGFAGCDEITGIGGEVGASATVDWIDGGAACVGEGVAT